jgi:hypothetical protein
MAYGDRGEPVGIEICNYVNKAKRSGRMSSINGYLSALEKACIAYAEFTDSCPFDMHGYEMTKCKNCDNNAIECWQKYFLWGE